LQKGIYSTKVEKNFFSPNLSTKKSKKNEKKPAEAKIAAYFKFGAWLKCWISNPLLQAEYPIKCTIQAINPSLFRHYSYSRKIINHWRQGLTLHF
jgi:hypothetical protein